MTSNHEMEHRWLNDLVTQLDPFLEKERLPKNVLRIAENITGTSLFFQTILICRVTVNRKVKLEVSEGYKKIVETYIPNAICKSGFYIIVSDHLFDIPIDFIEKLTEEAYMRLPKLFDCCSRYMECSNSKQCTNPDMDHALGCGYRRIMRTGKIFYGKNRNIGNT